MNARFHFIAAIVAITAIAALVAPVAFGAGQSSANFSIPKDSVNAGIADTSSANYTLRSTIGEAVYSMQTNSANNRIDAGFRAQSVVTGPAMTLSPTTLNLGSNPVGVATASMDVTIGNQGTSSLTLSAISITGANSADFVRTGTCTPTSTLLPATTCTITVTFTPGGIGARSATLTVTGNDAVTPTRSTSLSGTGISSNPSINLTVNGSGTVSSAPAGIACPGTCSASFTPGSAVVLTASPTAGSILQSFAGCDATTGLGCTISPLNASRNVTATFVTSAATTPGAPVIGTAIPGNGQATINFTAPASNGGSPILGYTATCIAGPFGANGNTSPITVTGLTNGANYSCSVVAINGAGAGPASGSVNVTPAASALTLLRVYSRKYHGGAVPYEIDIDSMVGMSGFVTVEPRAIGAGHSIVFDFDAAITNAGGVSVVDANLNSVGAASSVASGNSVTVTLTGVPDNKRVMISLFGVNTNANASSAIGFLVGDVTGSRSVNAADISAVKARVGQPLGLGTFRYDVGATGTITSADVSLVKARSGLTLP